MFQQMDGEHLEELRTFVVSRREELKLTQEELARASGVPRSTIASIESGVVTRAPRIDTLALLAKGLRVEPSVLIDLALGYGDHNPPAKGSPESIAIAIARVDALIQEYERAGSEEVAEAVSRELESLIRDIGYKPGFNTPIDRIIKRR